MARRKISEMQTIVRQRYEGQLQSIEPLSDLARKLLSQEGFLDLFLEVRMLYPTHEEAYEMLEEQHERISSQEFEQAVNQVLLSDTVSDATKKPLITPEGSKPRPPLTVKSETDIFAPGCTYTRPIDILDT